MLVIIMDYGRTFARLRKESNLSQIEVSDYINRYSTKPYNSNMVSHWENGVSSPPVEQFLLLCELYGVTDIQGTFRGVETKPKSLPRLNTLGKRRVEEYIASISCNPLFLEQNDREDITRRYIKLYDVSVTAGLGNFLDNDSYSELEVDEAMPKDADFALRISGDSMEPRFINDQIVFIKKQQTLNIGEVGIFGLNSEAYMKKLGNGELLSLNVAYCPIPIREFDSIHVFGKVVG